MITHTNNIDCHRLYQKQNGRFEQNLPELDELIIDRDFRILSDITECKEANTDFPIDTPLSKGKKTVKLNGRTETACKSGQTHQARRIGSLG